MDVAGTQKDILTWARGASRYDRMEFLKQYVLTLEEDELTGCKALANRRKRCYRKAFFNASEPVNAASVPLKKAKKFWWEYWSEEEIVALDCEMITLKKLQPGQKKKTSLAGTISVVDFNGKPLKGFDNRKIKHEKGSFIVNTHTRKINKFEEDSLKDGDDMEEVVKELTEKIKGKLIVTCAGVFDFNSLNLSITQFDHFDIQWFWKERVINVDGVQVEELLGLRRIYYYYYKKDIQSGAHDATTDATATMKLFREQFIPHCKRHELYVKSEHYELFENFPKIK